MVGGLVALLWGTATGLLAILWGTVTGLVASLWGLVTGLSLLHWTLLVTLLVLAIYHLVQVKLKRTKIDKNKGVTFLRCLPSQTEKLHL